MVRVILTLGNTYPAISRPSDKAMQDSNALQKIPDISLLRPRISVQGMFGPHFLLSLRFNAFTWLDAPLAACTLPTLDTLGLETYQSLPFTTPLQAIVTSGARISLLDFFFMGGQ